MIYFIQAEIGGPIKIGYAEDINARLAEIQRMCPFKLRIISVTNGDLTLEKHIHNYFGSSRSHGEWFLESPELLTFIKKPVPIHCPKSNGLLCLGIRRNGESCNHLAHHGKRYCIYHISQESGLPDGWIIPRDKPQNIRCGGIGRRGKPCGNWAALGSNSCKYHTTFEPTEAA